MQRSSTEGRSPCQNSPSEGSHHVVIASAARTAVGSFNGAFGNTPAHELGASAIKAVLERAGIEAGEVDEVTLGQVLFAGEGENPARQPAMKADIPRKSPPGHGPALWFRIVALGMQQIATGGANIIVAGGMKSMSVAPHCAHLRTEHAGPAGDAVLIETPSAAAHRLPLTRPGNNPLMPLSQT